MRFMNSFNRITGNWMPLIVLLCLFTGITFSASIGRLIFLVPYIFAFMTFVGALNSSFRQIADLARHPLPLLVSYLVVHALIPLIALAAGEVFFGAEPDIVAGTVLEYAVPVAVTSVMWSAIAGGNMALTLSILLLDTLTAPVVIPFTLRFLIGSNAQVNAADMMLDLLWMVTLPALLAMLLNQLSNDRAGKKLSPVLAPFSKLALISIITINSTLIAPFVKNMSGLQYEVILMIFVLAVMGYLLGLAAAKLLRQDSDVASSMVFGCGMRNISAGTVIAAAYFPAEVMFPVMAGTLFQQALASLFAYILTRKNKDEKKLRP